MSQYAAEYEFIFGTPFEPGQIDRGDHDDEWAPEPSDSKQERPRNTRPSRRRRIVNEYVFGSLPGVWEGDTYESRRALHRAGVHLGLRCGIHGRKEEGAFSIVMSGVYEDDADRGERVFYTGTGGLKKSGEGGPQVQDQSFEHRMNASLLKSIETGKPVRVVRGHELRSKYAPREGFRYDGLYTVVNAEMRKGRSGHDVCIFELERIPGQQPIPILGIPSTSSTAEARRDRPARASTSTSASRPKRPARPRDERSEAGPSGARNSTPGPSTPSPRKRARRDGDRAAGASAMDVDPPSAASVPRSRPFKRARHEPGPERQTSDASKRPRKDAPSRNVAPEEEYSTEFEASVDKLVSVFGTGGSGSSRDTSRSQAGESSRAPVQDRKPAGVSSHSPFSSRPAASLPTPAHTPARRVLIPYWPPATPSPSAGPPTTTKSVDSDLRALAPPEAEGAQPPPELARLITSGLGAGGSAGLGLPPAVKTELSRITSTPASVSAAGGSAGTPDGAASPPRRASSGARDDPIVVDAEPLESLMAPMHVDATPNASSGDSRGLSVDAI